MPGFESPAGKLAWHMSCHPSSRIFFDVALRMQVKLQPYKLEVAGSNPAGSKFFGAVAQWVEHGVSPNLVARAIELSLE